MVNNKLKEKREEKRLTQDELAAKSGVSRQTIIWIETNEDYNPTLGTLTKLSKALDCPLQDIFLA